VKGWISIWLTSWWPQPATDHCWLASAPITQWPCIVNATAAGPMLYLPAPSRRSVAVGNVKVGPAPQINAPGFAGDRKSVGLMSPMRKALSMWGKSDGWLMMGMMVRVMNAAERCQLAMALKHAWNYTELSVLQPGFPGSCPRVDIAQVT